MLPYGRDEKTTGTDRIGTNLSRGLEGSHYQLKETRYREQKMYHLIYIADPAFSQPTFDGPELRLCPHDWTFERMSAASSNAGPIFKQPSGQDA